MKNNKPKLLYIVILIIILIGIIFYTVMNRKCNCEPIIDENNLVMKDIGKIQASKIITNQIEIPNIDFTAYFNVAMNVNNDTIKNLKLYNYNIITSINQKKDTSIWAAVKLVDILKYFGENATGKFIAYDSNYFIKKSFDNIDNVYLLLTKNDQLFEIENNNVAILADITKDSDNWLYNPGFITNN